MTQLEFIELISPFKDKVYRLAKRLLVSKDEAEDATQEVLLKLWNNKEKMKSYKNVEAFSMTMTKNYCLDRLKSKQAQNLKIVHSNYSDNNLGLHNTIEINDSLNWMSKIIQQLPNNQKLILQLRDIEQYDFKNIAKMLDMNETAVRVALSRARKKIKDELLKIHRYGTAN